MREIIDADTARQLREARELLIRLGSRFGDAARDMLGEPWTSDPDAADYTRCVVLAEVAEQAIFDFLNTARHHADQAAVDFNVNREKVD